MGNRRDRRERGYRCRKPLHLSLFEHGLLVALLNSNGCMSFSFPSCSFALISDHQNVYKSLILKNSVEHVRSNILHALNQEIKLLFQKGVLTFETLSILDRKKAEEYNTAGVYLHVIYELEQPSIYWLYVGASIDVQSRVEEHKCFRSIPSRDSLHPRIWNQEGRGDFFILFGGFSNIHVPEQDQLAMINLLERFGCQVFQTLPKSVLQKDFPEKIDIIQPV